MAEEIREIMAELGYRNFDEMIGSWLKNYQEVGSNFDRFTTELNINFTPKQIEETLNILIDALRLKYDSVCQLRHYITD